MGVWVVWGGWCGVGGGGIVVVEWVRVSRDEEGVGKWEIENGEGADEGEIGNEKQSMKGKLGMGKESLKGNWEWGRSR